MWVTLGVLPVETICGLPRLEIPLGLHRFATATPGHPVLNLVTSVLLIVPRFVLLYKASLHPPPFKLASILAGPALSCESSVELGLYVARSLVTNTVVSVVLSPCTTSPTGHSSVLLLHVTDTLSHRYYPLVVTKHTRDTDHVYCILPRGIC